MGLAFRLTNLVFAAGLTLAVSVGAATAQSTPFEPKVGQDGKDVVWVPTAQDLVDRMLEMAKVTPQDYVIDLGSGDGRTVITAAKLGVKAHGIEYDEKLVELSKQNAAKANVSDKATFAKADIFESDFSQATVITMFLLEQLNLKLRPTLLGLKPGTRLVTNTFKMGDWKSDAAVELKAGCTTYCNAYLWIVPAQVAGQWQVAHEGENAPGPLAMKLAQEFQEVTGTAEPVNGKATDIAMSVSGAEVGFKAGGAEYKGKVEGESAAGTYRLGDRSGSWKATRVKKAQ